MNTQTSKQLYRSLPAWMILILVVLALPVTLAAMALQDASVRDLEIASKSGGGELGNGGSFFVSSSHDGRYIVYESLATNLASEPSSDETNFSDIYIRDRSAQTTVKVSKSKNGGLTNEASLDPTISADGRYVAYFSYASNIIYNDTNGAEYSRQGLDVFVWDRFSGQNTRVSLDENGKEIDGNSVGSISPDGQYIMFVSSGRVLADDWDSNHSSALYMRDWHSGEIERISVAQDGGFPNLGAGMATVSVDNRYVVYDSWSSNLASDDNNSEVDVFLYDRLNKTTKLISRGLDGQSANGKSVQSKLSLDGKTITFVSTASNLVHGDNNGVTDVFVYDMDSGAISLVSKREDGGQSNGESKEPSVCGNGRFISYTTEATNLFDNDVNNQRDVILYDRMRGTNSVATINWQGVLGNAKAHRSSLTADCHSIAFASDASNLVPEDDNVSRDIFVGKIDLPADLSRSTANAPGSIGQGETITYTFTLRNIGYSSATAVLVSPVPTQTTYLTGSVSAGGVYNAGQNQIEWQGSLDGESEQTVTYAAIVEPAVADHTVIAVDSILSGDGHIYSLKSVTVVNGEQTFLPLASRR